MYILNVSTFMYIRWHQVGCAPVKKTINAESGRPTLVQMSSITFIFCKGGECFVGCSEFSSDLRCKSDKQKRVNSHPNWWGTRIMGIWTVCKLDGKLAIVQKVFGLLRRLFLLDSSKIHEIILNQFQQNWKEKYFRKKRPHLKKEYTPYMMIIVWEW